MTDQTRDLPDRIVVGANGAYWRDYGDHYSMCVISEDNDPVEIVAIYNRNEADATAWDRGFLAGFKARPAVTTDPREAVADALLVLKGEYQKPRLEHKPYCAKVGPYGGVGLGGGSRSGYRCTCGQPERQAIVDAGVRAALATSQPDDPSGPELGPRQTGYTDLRMDEPGTVARYVTPDPAPSGVAARNHARATATEDANGGFREVAGCKCEECQRLATPDPAPDAVWEAWRRVADTLSADQDADGDIIEAAIRADVNALVRSEREAGYQEGKRAQGGGSGRMSTDRTSHDAPPDLLDNDKGAVYAVAARIEAILDEAVLSGALGAEELRLFSVVQRQADDPSGSDALATPNAAPDVEGPNEGSRRMPADLLVRSQEPLAQAAWEALRVDFLPSERGHVDDHIASIERAVWNAVAGDAAKATYDSIRAQGGGLDVERLARALAVADWAPAWYANVVQGGGEHEAGWDSDKLAAIIVAEYARLLEAEQ